MKAIADVVRFTPGDVVFGDTLVRPGAGAARACLTDAPITEAHITRGQRARPALIMGTSGGPEV